MFAMFATVHPNSDVQHREKYGHRFEAELLLSPFSARDKPRASLGEQTTTGRQKFLIDRTQ
jgi:hypothetical protein